MARPESSNDELRIQELVEEALNSESTPEEVCREFPGLLAQVRQHLALVLDAEGDLDLLFPPRESPQLPHSDESQEPALPTIPGYEVKGHLGRGGMGVVYRARQLSLGRDVALKMLLAGEFASPRELERFFLEARAIANLSHPNIVQVYDVSEREGRPYFTMELVEGGTLALWLNGLPQASDKAAEIVIRIAAAVEVAHKSGIVHRDLKPANVLLTLDGVPKVADFGLARRVSGAENLTATGAILGTPSYMAPEQIRGSAVGAGADVYSLGAILYEILTGKPPFHAHSPLATQLEVLSREAVRPSLLNRKVTRDLDTICLRCLHKEPARRYESAAELAADLQRFLAHEPIRARPMGGLERSLLWGRRHPTKVSIISLGCALAVLLVGRAVHNETLARTTRERDAVWTPRVDNAFEQLRSGELAQARSLLDQVPDTLSEQLRQRVSEARSELLLVEQLDGIRMHRVAVTRGHFDRSANRKVADEAYERAFHAAGFGAVGDAPDIVAARVRAAAVRLELLGALDDWAFCAADEQRGTWLLEVARSSDPDPSPWRERLREPKSLDTQALAELGEEMRAHRVSVQLLVAAAERMREAEIDVIPLLMLVQSAHPGDFWVNFALGDALGGVDAKEAIRYAQSAVAIRPRSSIAFQGLGAALRMAERMEDAVKACRQAVLLEPGYAEAHALLAVVLYYSKQLDEALAEGREAIRIDPNYYWARHNLGQTLETMGRTDEALFQYQEAARLGPRVALLHQSLATCLTRLGRRGEAATALRSALELDPNPGRHYELGACLLDLQDFTAAEVELRSAYSGEPASTYARSGLRACLVTTGREEQALALSRDAVQANPADPQAWDGYAELCAFLDRGEEYSRACVELLERFGASDEPRDCERIGRACLLRASESTLDGAVTLIERAVASPRSPPWIGPYFGVAHALAEYRSGRFESALTILQGDAGRVLTPMPTLIRSMALHHTGASASARHELAAAALSQDWSPTATGDSDGWIRHVLRREAEALILPEMEELIAGRQEPRDEDTRTAMIGALIARSRYAAAARLYERAFGGSFTDTNWEQRYRAARMVARAGDGLGVDPAEASERAHFRKLVRKWLRNDLLSCASLLESSRPDRRAVASQVLNPWRDDPAFSGMRDAQAMEQLPPAEREDCQALWVEVATFVHGLEAKD